MVNNGTKNVLYINNKPVTRAEKDQYVATAMVPNIAKWFNRRRCQ